MDLENILREWTGVSVVVQPASGGCVVGVVYADASRAAGVLVLKRRDITSWALPSAIHAIWTDPQWGK